MIIYKYIKSHLCDIGKEKCKMCDIAKLKGKIVENGFNQIALAKQTGMDRSTLNRKLKTGETFTIGEANKIATVLKLTKAEAMAIFFTNIVA